jgi:multiple sugar transport system permease protein
VVTREDEAGAPWRVVPRSALVKKTAPRWGNFGKAIRAMKFFPQYLRNTVVLCLLTVVGTVASSSLAAYGFSRISWRGRDRTFIIVLATMMIPFPVVMVPLYSLFRWLGWIGTLKPLWVGSFFAGAFNVFLLRQFFLTIPKDLSDAARIDGCSEWRIFWQIILPLSRPVLLVVALFQFMYTWNDYLGPLIYLTDQNDFTLALGLQFYQSQQGGTEWHYLMAASTLIILPVLILFFFTQKTFIEGISMTGIKG